MKKVLLLAFLPMFISQLVSCSGGKNDDQESQKVRNIGKLSVENGEGKMDTINYLCTGCEEMLPSKKEFDKLVEEATERTRENLKYPLSFKPRDLVLTLIKLDTLISFKKNEPIKNVIKVIVDYKYIAKNTYGNELEGDYMGWFYLQDLKITKLEEDIKLEPLRIVDGSVNRSLELLSHNGEETLKIISGNNGSIIAITSLGCVDKGSWLLLKLENGDEIKLVSWNDFNCDGASYFKGFTTTQKEKLKAHRLESISFIDDKSMVCIIPNNQSDYFQQLVAL